MHSLFLLAIVSLSAESRIDSVVAYPDQAMVIRRATVNISGTDQLIFSDLTGMLDDNSIRVRAAGLKIGEVQVKPGYIAEPTGMVKRLQDSLDRLNQQDRTFRDEQDVVKAKETFLNSIKLGAPELMSKELSTGQVNASSWSAALNFMSTEMVATRKRTAELELIRADLAKVITAVNQELGNARARWENHKTVTVDVAAVQPGSFAVTLSYNVPSSVSWSPYYELRAAPSSQTVGVTYFARVSQHSNEDWDNVALLLSTARPSAGGVAPEPVGWYLDIYEPAKQGRVYKAAEEAPAPMMAPGYGEVDKLEAAEAPLPPPIETGISLQYVIPGRVSLKSGEDPKKLFLHDANLPAEFAYYAYPRIEELAYLRGKLQNNTDFIFLAGQGNTYVGDEFTGETYFSSIAPGESADLSFGVDDRVKVKHELVKSLTSKSGLTGNLAKVDFTYKTTVENYHTKPITMKLVEQVPVARNKSIKVTLTTLDPKPTETDNDLGTSTLTFELQPQAKYIVNLGYSVEYPSGKQISGLY